MGAFDSKMANQMKKDRASHEKVLSGATTKLLDTLKTNKEAQDKINGSLSAATKAAGMKAVDELKEAKECTEGRRRHAQSPHHCQQARQEAQQEGP